MIRSGFRKLSFEEIKEKQASKRLQAVKKLKDKRSIVKGGTRRVATPKRAKLPNKKTVRNKCDNLLTPIIKEKYPNCLLRGAQSCAGVTQVAHHHVHKSSSSHLRYDIENLIPLCGACHVMLHNDESYWGAKVAQIKGTEWFDYISAEKHISVKTDVHFYISNHERLQTLLRSL